MVWLLTIGLIIIIAVQVPPLVRNKMWGELGAFTFFMLLAMVYGYGQVFELPLPNPTNGLEMLFGPLADWLNKTLGAPE